jgi:hypothetical protein
MFHQQTMAMTLTNAIEAAGVYNAVTAGLHSDPGSLACSIALDVINDPVVTASNLAQVVYMFMQPGAADISSPVLKNLTLYKLTKVPPEWRFPVATCSTNLHGLKVCLVLADGWSKLQFCTGTVVGDHLATFQVCYSARARVCFPVSRHNILLVFDYVPGASVNGHH